MKKIMIALLLVLCGCSTPHKPDPIVSIVPMHLSNKQVMERAMYAGSQMDAVSAQKEKDNLSMGFYVKGEMYLSDLSFDGNNYIISYNEKTPEQKNQKKAYKYHAKINKRWNKLTQSAFSIPEEKFQATLKIDEISQKMSVYSKGQLKNAADKQYLENLLKTGQENPVPPQRVWTESEFEHSGNINVNHSGNINHQQNVNHTGYVNHGVYGDINLK